MPNHLSHETSPYLLQHARNPVDWYPWGEEALKRARAEDKPILLSIGYSACHWCHVMAHECFENQQIADLMNENFINIKVDREERPDLDAIYMEAVQSMRGSGGWPLTVFLTPEGKPFYGGTYFPPEDRQGMAGLPRTLQTMAEAYHSNRCSIDQIAEKLVTSMAAEFSPGTTTEETLATDIVRQAFVILKKNFDTESGGFGTAPKFPQPMVLEFLLRYFKRSQVAAALNMVETTLQNMSRGGVYDQLGGGFHRYATDRRWMVPHFEKMLYDNALLSQVYLHAYLITDKPLYRIIVEDTISYVLREMTDRKGGFYSSQDADSEGIEGKYYLWTPDDITAAVGKKDSAAVCQYFGVTPGGNFEGQNVLHVAVNPMEEIPEMFKKARASLLEAREKRAKPARDDKILASWNGLMLTSLAEAACAFDRKDYLDAAEANGSFLLGKMVDGGHLKHAYNDGKVRIDGFLEDYALVIEGLLALHQATFGGRWLREAIKLAEKMVAQFWDEDTQALYDVDKGQKDLILRPRSLFDTSMPSGSSAATGVLLKLALLTGNGDFQRVAEQSLRSMNTIMGRQPLATSNWLCDLDFHFSTPREIAIFGPRHEPETIKLLNVLSTTWLPNKVVAAYDPKDRNRMPGLKLLENRALIDDKPAVYVCQGKTCKTPATTPTTLKIQLQSE